MLLKSLPLFSMLSFFSFSSTRINSFCLTPPGIKGFNYERSMYKQWRTGQDVGLPDGEWAALTIRQDVKNVNGLLVA